MRRRIFLGGMTAMAASTALGQTAGGIVQRASSRVIVDNDFAGDPDGLFALAHQLLSPKARTVLITASPLNAKLATLAGMTAGKTAAAGSRLTQDLVGRLGQSAKPAVVSGAETFGAGAEQITGAARAIVAEALRDDPLPLVVTCGGPLTNIAAALRLDPSIAKRMRLVWIGGSSAPDGGVEYNLSTDIAAARYVLEESTVPVWQIPELEYKRFQISVAELTSELRPVSPISEWLYSQYRHLPPFVQLGGSLTMGDSAMVSLTAFNPGITPFTVRRVRRILDDSRYGEEIDGRQVHMYHSFDVRLNMADFRALLRLHASRP